MKIIVVGCGKIGTSIISRFLSEGHDVVAIDNDASVIREISNIYDVICVCGNGSDCETLEQAGVKNANVVVAVTSSDEFNMLSCFIARRMGAHHTIARIRNPEYNDNSLGFMTKELHISLAINPEKLAAKELSNILKFPSAVNIETFCAKRFEMIELRLKENSPLINMRLMDIRKKYPANFLVCAVKRGEEVYIPGGSFVLQENDVIALTAAPYEIQKLLKQLGILQKGARNIIILGASKTAYYLAEMLLKSGNSVKIIELNQKRCEEFAAALPGVVMINGDGASRELLLEEGIKNADAFVSLTGMDEENILISIFAASQDVPKVITKVNRVELAEMAEKLGLDTIVTPKNIIADVVTSYSRALHRSLGSRVEAVHKLMNDQIEALEFEVSEDFAYKGISLSELSLKPHILLAGIIRKRKTIIPSGSDCILSGDRVIVLSSQQSLKDLSDIIL